MVISMVAEKLQPKNDALSAASSQTKVKFATIFTSVANQKSNFSGEGQKLGLSGPPQGLAHSEYAKINAQLGSAHAERNARAAVGGSGDPRKPVGTTVVTPENKVPSQSSDNRNAPTTGAASRSVASAVVSGAPGGPGKPLGSSVVGEFEKKAESGDKGVASPTAKKSFTALISAQYQAPRQTVSASQPAKQHSAASSSTPVSVAVSPSHQMMGVSSRGSEVLEMRALLAEQSKNTKDALLKQKRYDTERDNSGAKDLRAGLERKNLENHMSIKMDSIKKRNEIKPVSADKMITKIF